MRLSLWSACLVPALPLLAAWELHEEPGRHLDVRRDGRPVARYMFAHDPSTKETLHDTYKPYLHVFDAEGKAPITKGPGGDFTHHRGIFIGWNKITCAGKTYDRWHMKGGEQVHRAFSARTTNAQGASFTSQVDWNDAAGQPFLREERTFRVTAAPAPGYVLIDMTSTLAPVAEAVSLGGDPEHAGCHFRPAQEIRRDQTEYLFPRAGADARKDRDYPWVAERFVLPSGTFSVALLNHPGNPTGTAWSAYRHYGRFGAFPTAKIGAGEKRAFRYGFLVAAGDFPSPEVIQRTWDGFAGATASPVPEVTRKPADGAKPK
jgi:hypothetical protein